MTAPAPPADPAAPVLDALRELLVPLAQLAVARGVPHAPVDEMLRTAFVAAAHAAHPLLPEHRRVSRVSAATGINRREVVRLAQAAAQAPAPMRSYPSEAFAHWTTDPDYRDRRGRPRILPRLGEAPSFESLARSITRDMHPRSLLAELQRLGLVTHDAGRDTVALVREAFVPRGDAARMLAFLGANVGDHLSAAVANVQAQGNEHFEQAIFASGLSAHSLAALRTLVTAQWRALTADLVPQLEKMIATDEAAQAEGRDGDGDTAPAAADRRVRIGLFTFEAPMPVAPAPAKRARVPAPAQARKRVARHR